MCDIPSLVSRSSFILYRGLRNVPWLVQSGGMLLVRAISIRRHVGVLIHWVVELLLRLWVVEFVLVSYILVVVCEVWQGACYLCIGLLILIFLNVITDFIYNFSFFRFVLRELAPIVLGIYSSVVFSDVYH